MDQFFQPHRKFSWAACGFCGAIAAILAVLVVYGAITIASVSQESRENERKAAREVMEKWNSTYEVLKSVSAAVELQGSEIALLPNETDDYRVKGRKTYPHFKLYAVLPLFSNALVQVPDPSVVFLTQSEAYNLTTNLSLSYSTPTFNHTAAFLNLVVFRKTTASFNEKMCLIHNYGVWDRNNQVCLVHFILTDLCFVYNLSSETIEEGCFGSVEKWSHYEWTESGLPRDNSSEADVTVRASTDPALADALLKDAASIVHIEKVIVGALAIVVGCLLFLVPIVYFWQVCRSKDQGLLHPRGLELAQVREGYMPRY